MTDWTSFVREHLQHAADDPARENDIIEELAQHLAQREAELVSGGIEPEAARQRVIEELPEWQRLAREIRRADRVRPMAPPPPPLRRGNPFAALWRDVVYAARTLRKSPTYTAVALTVLALGIGATTAVFSIVDAVVLRGLPYDEPDRLVAVREEDPKRPAPFPYVAPEDFLDWREQQRSFEAMAAARGQLVQIRDAEGHLRTHSARFVTADYFRVLRASPTLGRAFAGSEQTLGRDGVAVLDHRFWQARFGGRPDAIGRTLTIDGRPVVIVGVMPADFTCQVVMANASAELYMPLVAADGDRQRGRSPDRGLTVVGRLKPGVSIAQASDDMSRIRAGIEAQYPTWAPGVRVQVVTLHEQRFGQVAKWVLMLFGTVAFVLVIACANVANLMLARASIRDREIAIRAALGASRATIVRGLLIEALLLSLAGAALGALLAWGGVSAVRGWLPLELTRVASIAVDLRALAGAVVAALATGIGFGLVPAFRSSRPDLSSALTHRAPSGTGAGTHRLRHALVVSEVALTVVLLVGAGLFITSFVKLLRVDVGFDYRHVLSVLARPFPGGRQHGLDGTLQMLDAVGRLPGVEASAAVSGEVLFSGIRGRASVAIPARGDLPAEDAEVSARSVTPTYHRLLGIPLVRGRYLTDADRAGAASVVLVNQTAARKYWPGQEALGQRLVVNRRETVVVGIVADVRHWRLEGPVEPECYLPLLQGSAAGQMILVRTAGNPLTVLPAIRKAIWSVNNDVPIIGDEGTAEDRLNRLLAQRRFSMALLVLFGVLGLAISAVGIYGVLAYLVDQRTNEIGVRMALGATAGGVVAMVLRRAGALIGIGLAIGTGVALYAGRFAKSFLFQLEPNDPRVFAAALTVLALAGFVASVVPARRAAAVDPIVALRRE